MISKKLDSFDWRQQEMHKLTIEMANSNGKKLLMAVGPKDSMIKLASEIMESESVKKAVVEDEHRKRIVATLSKEA